MPNIFVTVPQGAFPPEARARLVRRINDAAVEAEQMPGDPRSHFLTWLVIEEAGPGMWTCGGADVGAQVLPCFAIVHVPAGVLDDAARALYVKLLHQAFEQALPAAERRRLATSIILHDVAEGAWGGNGAIWTLPTLARAAGYAHLRHLAAGAPPA